MTDICEPPVAGHSLDDQAMVFLVDERGGHFVPRKHREDMSDVDVTPRGSGKGDGASIVGSGFHALEIHVPHVDRAAYPVIRVTFIHTA